MSEQWGGKVSSREQVGGGEYGGGMSNSHVAVSQRGDGSQDSTTFPPSMAGIVVPLVPLWGGRGTVPLVPLWAGWSTKSTGQAEVFSLFSGNFGCVMYGKWSSVTVVAWRQSERSVPLLCGFVVLWLVPLVWLLIPLVWLLIPVTEKKNQSLFINKNRTMLQ